MILDFLRKPLTVVDFLVLLLLSPVIISIVIFIAIILEPSDIPSIKDQPYECGRFGDQQIKIDRNYLFFARVEYQDVNYWGKNVREQHNIKGCDDQIQNASFDVKWPEMEHHSSVTAHAFLKTAFHLSHRASVQAVFLYLLRESDT
jgi:hypothetical protein